MQHFFSLAPLGGQPPRRPLAGYLFLLLALLLTLPGLAQTISSFTPTSGPVGTSVTFTGTGFNAVTSQNVVFFGATQAPVTAASATSLTVTVPLGTTYQYPTVTNLASALTAYARQPFVVTLNGAVAFVPTMDFATGSAPYWVALWDVDGDGQPDLVVANTSSNTVSVLRNTGAAGMVSFAPKADFAAGTSPISVAIGDVDGDGRPDLAVANQSSNTVSVLRNTGTAGTVSFAARAAFATASGPIAVAFGDVDGDGKPDLTTANFGSNTVSVLRNTSAAGTVSFAARVSFATGSTPYWVSLGDVDGDGRPDLATANFGSNTVSVLRNTSAAGTVSFAAKADFATGSAPYWVAIGDVDGDGRPDLAVANYTSNTVSVLRNTGAAGTVSFAPKADFATGTGPASVAIGDVDGDGRPDLAVANVTSNTVSVLRQVALPPVISSFTPTSGPVGTSVTITGTNLDGASSVRFNGTAQTTFTSTSATQIVLAVPAGTSTGTLTVTTPGGTSAASSQPFTVTVPLITSFTPTSGPVGTSVTITGTDLGGASSVGFNGTAQTTFTSNSTTQIVLLVPAGATTGTLTVTTPGGTSAVSSQPFTVTVPLITSFTPTSGPVGTSVTITGTSLGGASSVRFNGTAQTAFTSNSSTQIVLTVPAGATTGPLTVTTAGSTSAASSQPFRVPPLITSFTPTSGPVGTSVTIAGTGFSTVASQNVVFFGATQAPVTAASATSLTVTVPLGTTYQYPTVTNLATALTAYAGQPFVVTLNGAVAFAPTADFATNSASYSVALGDVDGDGWPDLVVANAGSNTVSVLRNTSTAGTVSFAPKVDFTSGSQPVSVALGDVDGDGRPDLVVANQGSNTVSVLRNTGVAGTVSFAATVDFATGRNPVSVVIGDVDGDGRPDLAVANITSNTVSVLRNTGAVGTVSFAATVDFPTGSQPYSVALGDVDGDGRPDLAVVSYASNLVSVFRNTGAAGTVSFAATVDAATGAGPIAVVIGDVDGDGRPDLATANYADATVSVLRNTGAAGTVSFAAKADVAAGAAPYWVALGDVDGDGRPDLAVANYTSNTVSVLRNTGAAGTVSFAARAAFATARSPGAVAIGDVDGDGKPDLAVATLNSATVSVLRQVALPPLISSFTPTSGPVGTSVTITGTDLGGASSVRFNGTAQTTFTSNSTTQIVLAVPAGATTGTLTVTTAGGTSAASSQTFTVTAPTLTAVAPNPGGLGQAITLTGTNLSSPTALTINGANALMNILSNGGTSLVVRVPVTAAASGVVSISTPTGTATAPFTVLAAPGNALAFDGVDDYVALPLSTPVPVGNSAYTIEAWIKPTAMGVYGIIGWGAYGTGNQVNALRLSPTGLVNYWWGPDLSVPTPDLSGRWHHVAATFDGTTRTLYLDGVAQGADTPGAHTVPDARNLRIGSTCTNCGGEYFPGRLDEVRVYTVALTPAQLRADMSSTTAAVPASLVLYYNLDQGTPATASTGANAGLTTLYDLVGAAPATLNNFALTSGNTTSNYVASYAMVVPMAITSTARSATGFTVNWTAPALGTVTSYLLDVSTTANFAAPIAGSPFAVAAPATSYALTGLSSSSAYYYRVRALNSALVQPDQGAYSNVVAQATPLPVELSAFTATAVDNAAVRLAWATASEQNSAAFEVERSADGKAFAAIGRVAAAGHSSSYGFLDAQLPANAARLYYRLRQVDLDGTFNYSPVRSVALSGKVGLSLYPNPATTRATLTGAVPGTVVTVFDALGRLVTSAPADATGTAALMLPAGQPAGVYVVRAGSQALRLSVE